MERMVRTSPASGAGSEANDNERLHLVPAGPVPCPANWSSALPPDAEAVIEPVPIATNQSGRARVGEWRLWFRPRRAPTVDSLTGWTGGADPLAHMTLRFPNRETAERFCARQGIRFETRPAPPSRPRAAPVRPSFEETPPVCCWPTGPHALCCGDYPIARAPADVSVAQKALQE